MKRRSSPYRGRPSTPNLLIHRPNRRARSPTPAGGVLVRRGRPREAARRRGLELATPAAPAEPHPTSRSAPARPATPRLSRPVRPSPSSPREILDASSWSTTRRRSTARGRIPARSTARPSSIAARPKRARRTADCGTGQRASGERDRLGGRALPALYPARTTTRAITRRNPTQGYCNIAIPPKLASSAKHSPRSSNRKRGDRWPNKRTGPRSRPPLNRMGITRDRTAAPRRPHRPRRSGRPRRRAPLRRRPSDARR